MAWIVVPRMVRQTPAVAWLRSCQRRACICSRKYASNRAKDSDAAHRLAYPQVVYITDGLHDRNHVDPWCLANCSCKVESNATLIRGDNSQVCEQLFAKIGRHKHVVRHMGRLTNAFLLNEFPDVLNQDWLTTRGHP